LRPQKKVDRVIRLLLCLMGMLTATRPGRARRGLAWAEAGDAHHGGRPEAPYSEPEAPAAAAWPDPPDPEPPWPPPPADTARLKPPGGWGSPPHPRRRRIPLWVKGGAAVAVVGLIFRRAIASVALMALSATLHFLGFNVHLPSIKFAWPWQTITAGTTTNTDLGPWVLQKIEGISKPALGQANFNFYFTHKVSKSLGPFPCWYASTFTRWATRPPPSTSTRDLPGGPRPRATTGCTSSVTRTAAGLVM
jgi:hypothetical protein